MPLLVPRWHYSFVNTARAAHRVIEHGWVGAPSWEAAIDFLRSARQIHSAAPAVKLYVHRRPGLIPPGWLALPQDGDQPVRQASLF